MANPMVFDDSYDGFIVTPTTDIEGKEKIQANGFETETYDYCFIGIRLTQVTVQELLIAMEPGSQFYLEIKFRTKGNSEIIGDPKYVHQTFDYDDLNSVDDPLELLMDGYYTLPLNKAVTSIKITGAKLYYVEALPAE